MFSVCCNNPCKAQEYAVMLHIRHLYALLPLVIPHVRHVCVFLPFAIPYIRHVYVLLPLVRHAHLGST